MFSSWRAWRTKSLLTRPVRRRRRFQPGVDRLEPRVLLTVSAVGGGSPLTFTEGISSGSSLAEFSSSDTLPSSGGTVSAEINWGDGASSPGTVVVEIDNPTRFSVTGQHTYSDETAAGSTLPITVVATDSADQSSATVTDSATVVDADVLTASPLAVTATENVALANAPLAQIFTQNEANSSDDFVATIDWGDGSQSAGQLTGRAGVFTLNGSHSYSEDGNYTVQSVVSDANGAAVTVESAARVVEAPLSFTGLAVSGIEQTPLTANVATFTHGDGTEPSGNFTATIDWGDGTTGTGAVTETKGTYTVSGSHTYAEDGAYPVTAVITDTSSGTATASTKATIAEAPLAATGVAVNAAELTALTAAVTTFTHGSGSEPMGDFTATVDWGDGTTGTGTVTAVDGTYTVSGSHTYAEDGTYAISVTINDASGGSITANTTASIAEAPLSATGAAFSGQAFSPLNETVATFSQGSGAEAAGDFSATINWGDGSSSPGEVSVAGGTYSVFGSHVYTATGVFGVNVRIDDLSSGSTTANSAATITAAPVASTAVAVVADEATTFSGPGVTFTQDGGSAPASNFSASIVWGDGASSKGTVTAAGGGYVVSGSHLYAEDGSYPITVIVDNIDGSPTTIDTTATIVEAPLVGGGLPVTGIEVTNATMPVATFTAGQEPVSSFTASIDWGEGVTTPGTITLLSSGQYQVSGTYGYLDEGSYPIAVTVTESGEPSSSTVIRTTATVSEGPPNADGPGIAGTPAQDYVSQLYRDVLDRPVDRPSSQILVNLLLAGQPRLVITEPLASSPEHLRLIVTQAYQNILGRAPESAGLDFWTAALGRGVTDEQLAATMIASDEFFHAAGGDNRAWVDAMYLKLLGRAADSNGEAFWLNALNQGQSRFEVALAIATSPEHEGSLVSADYAQLLHRTGSPAEINAWVLQMQAGMSDEALLARIAASDEYFDRLSEVQ